MAQTVIAYVTDLIFATKIGSTARSLNCAVHLVRDANAVEHALADGNAAALVIVDLNAAGDPLAAIRAAKSAGARAIAYVSHVQADLARAAKDAGADEVLARSVFNERLPAILGDPAQI